MCRGLLGCEHCDHTAAATISLHLGARDPKGSVMTRTDTKRTSVMQSANDVNPKFTISNLVANGALVGGELVVYALPGGGVNISLNYQGVCIYRQCVELELPQNLRLQVA